MTTPMISCDDAQALIPDLLDGTLSDTQRALYDGHVADCAECRLLARDLTSIRDDAAALPAFSPSRDLWAGIEARIETPVVSMNGRGGGAIGRWTTRQFAAAAVVLMAVTAGGTWMVATRTPAVTTLPVAAATAPPAARTDLVSVADQKGIATYEGEIAKLHDILTIRRGELDTATVTVIQKNLTVIDKAIAESKAALAADPHSAFLADRLNRAYDTKLDLLRSAAMLPSRT
ncbi:MAG: zf-HC2 domain-containing protein [Gemmatimonadaceae bacterium]